MNENPTLFATPSLLTEDLKNQVLAAIYRQYPLEHLLDEAAVYGAPTETDEKHLRQIFAALKRFGKTNAVGFSAIRQILTDKTRKASAEYRTVQEWESRLSLENWQKNVIFSHAVTFQMTSGCSNYCRRCNEWALPRVRRHFTRNAVDTLLDRLLTSGNDDLALYGGSDPLDWGDPPFDLGHVLQDLKWPARFSILTKVPKGKQELAARLVKTGISLSVSVTDRNKTRIQALEAKLGRALSKQHATSDLLIPACLDEDFTTVKPSITDAYGTEISTDGAFIIIPAFTSALYPFGHKKIPVTRHTRFFPVKKLGRPALLVDYFKPLEVTGPMGRFYLKGLMDVQVENILLDNGDYDLTPPGMRSVKEYFEIFDDNARCQRKKMTRSVVRRLKKQYLGQSGYAGLKQDLKTEYTQKVRAHLDFTRKCVVSTARICAAAFFIEAIRQYLTSAPVKTRIIARLTQYEFERLKARRPEPATLATPEQALQETETDAWQLFRYLSLALVHGHRDGRAAVLFASRIHAEYDPVKDRFIRKD